MTTHIHTLQIILLGLQSLVVLFLCLHDWIPLGRLNNLTAIDHEDSIQRRIFVTALGGVPAAICLYLSAQYFGRPYPHWVDIWLWVTYGVLFVGLLRAWWIPYLFLRDAERASRYQIIFAGTHKFLPERNGIAPDTLHTVFHLAVAATVVVLLILHFTN